MLLLNSMGFIDVDFLTLKINDEIHNNFFLYFLLLFSCLPAYNPKVFNIFYAHRPTNMQMDPQYLH